MSTSASNARSDRYEPEQAGMRNIAARDGYDAGDGFQHVHPQVWTNASTTSQSTYLPGSSYNNNTSYNTSSRRRSSVDDRSRETTAYRGQPTNWGREYTIPRRGRSAPRGRGYLPDEYSDSEESDYDYDDRERAITKRRQSTGRSGSRRRSSSRGAGIKQKLQELLGPDPSEMGKDNSEGKKWAATVAGAMAGGFAARTAKKDHWVPAALGAIIGGLTAREAEKAFYLHKDNKEKEIEAWGRGRE